MRHPVEHRSWWRRVAADPAVGEVTGQPTLWDTWRQARTGDPKTSHLAAHRNRYRLIKQRKDVWEALCARGDGTCYEVAETGRALGFDMDHYQAARRLPELEEMGLVTRKGTGTRKNHKGNDCDVWKVIGHTKSPNGDPCRLWGVA